jgi:hypothetical protein
MGINFTKENKSRYIFVSDKIENHATFAGGYEW